MRKRIISGQWMDAVYRTWNIARCYVVRHVHVFALTVVVMDRVDQPTSVALGCTIINWLAATISVCVAYVVAFSMSLR